MLKYKTRILHWAALFAALVLFSSPRGLAQGTRSADQPTSPEVRPLYVIEPNDVLKVFVWKEPELSGDVLVRPDGRISFPLVQDLPAAGLTPSELRDRIENKLKEYIEAPTVTVIVSAIQHYQVYVTGKVQKPGSFVMVTPITVLQAISLAGGFQEYADESNISIVRSGEKEPVVMHFNYKDVVKGKNTYENIILKSGDVVVVP